MCRREHAEVMWERRRQEYRRACINTIMNKWMSNVEITLTGQPLSSDLKVHTNALKIPKLLTIAVPLLLPKYNQNLYFGKKWLCYFIINLLNILKLVYLILGELKVF